MHGPGPRMTAKATEIYTAVHMAWEGLCLHYESYT